MAAVKHWKREKRKDKQSHFASFPSSLKTSSGRKKLITNWDDSIENFKCPEVFCIFCFVLLRSIENVSCWAKTSSGIGDAVITRVYPPPSGHLADTTKPWTFLYLHGRDGVWVRLSGIRQLSDGSTHHRGGETNKHKHLAFFYCKIFVFHRLVGVMNSMPTCTLLLCSIVCGKWMKNFLLPLACFDWLNFSSLPFCVCLFV